MSASTAINPRPFPAEAEAAEGSPPRARLTAVPRLASEQESPPSDPSDRFVRTLAAHAFEVVEGVRTIAQLGPTVSVGAARQLALQRGALRERRQLYRDARSCVPSPGRVHLCRIDPLLIEATVAVHTERRTHAVALRLEWVRSRWRACELYVM